MPNHMSMKIVPVNRGSYMSAHVLLDLLNELRKRDKMRGLSSILSLFRNEFNKFNNTRARMLSLFHMHNIRPGANIHPGCKFAPGVYFGHVNGVL